MNAPAAQKYFRPSARALAVFAEYLAGPNARDEAIFEKLALDHASLAGDLRQLRDEWKHLKPAGAAGGRDDYHRILEGLYGTGASTARPARGWTTTEPGGARATSEDAAEELLNSLRLSSGDDSRYQFRGIIDVGGMGVVFRVYDRRLRRHLAMKMMQEPIRRAEGSAPLPSQHLQIRRFLEEAQVAGQLDHPGIVAVHDLGTDASGRLFFTMKLVKGNDLRRIIDWTGAEKYGWTVRRAAGVLVKLCEAVAFAHAKGVIHRDIKPANIMVGRFGEVYLMDWGVARALARADSYSAGAGPRDDPNYSTVHTFRRDLRELQPGSPYNTMDGSVLGTPAYMAPEQAMGLLEAVNERSDIYSIGAILYHLLAGHMPYVAAGARVSQRAILGFVVQGPPPPRSSRKPAGANRARRDL